MCPGRQRPHALECCARRQRRPVSEDFGERLEIDSARHLGQREQRLDFGSEQESSCGLGVEQRPDAGAVAGEHQSPLLGVPQRDRELPVQVVNKTFAVLLVKVNDDFRVRMGVKLMALSGQFAPQLHVVENLAIEHHPDRAILVVDRLVAAGQVDDAQTRLG